MRYGRPRRRPVARRRPTARRRVKRPVRRRRRNPPQYLGGKKVSGYGAIGDKAAATFTKKEREKRARDRRNALARKRRAAAKKKGKKKKAGGKKKAVSKKKVSKKRGKLTPAQKAARTRKANAKKRREAGLKAARTRARNLAKKKRGGKKKAAAKKRKPAARTRKKVSKKRGKLTKAQRSAAAKKGHKTRRKNMAKKVRRRKRTKYSYRPPKRKGKKRRKPLGNYRGKRRKTISGKRRGKKWASTAKRRKRRYAVVSRARRSKNNKRFKQTYYPRLNPMTNLKRMVKDGVYTFGGILGIRALCYTLENNVFNSATFKTGTLGKIAPVLPAAVAMLLAALSPKVIKGSPRLVQGLQAGATLVFFDSVLTAVLKATGQTDVAKYLLPGASIPALPGATEGWSEYVGAPMGGMGLEVESAMALDEYVAGPGNQLGMGGDFDVEEALAGNEGQAFETGYAGGSLAKTVFSNF